MDMCNNTSNENGTVPKLPTPRGGGGGAQIGQRVGGCYGLLDRTWNRHWLGWRLFLAKPKPKAHRKAATPPPDLPTRRFFIPPG